MQTIEELQVLIKANASQFKNEIEAVKRQLSELQRPALITQKSLSSAGLGFTDLTLAMTAANVVAGVFTGAINKLVNGLINIAGMTIEAGSQFSRMKSANDHLARNLGVTRNELQGLRNDLADANTYGIYAEQVIKSLMMTGLIPMARNIERVDARTGELKGGISGLVLAMKDLAAASGIDSQRGIELLTEFIMGNNQAVAEGIIQVGSMATEYREYAAQMGKQRSELTAAEEAQVRLNIVLRESEKAFGAYANAMQSSGKAFDSIKAASASIFAIMGSYLEPILSVIANGVFQLVNSIRQAVVGAEGVVVPFAIRIAGVLVAAFRIIGRVLSSLPVIGKYFQGLAKFSVKPTTIFKNVKKNADGLAKGLKNAGNAAKDLKKELGELAKFDEMDILGKAADNINKGLGDIGGGGGAGGGGIEDMDLGDWGLSEDNANKINEIADRILAKIQETKDKIIGIISPLGETIGNILGTAGGIITPIWESITDNISDAWNEKKDTIQKNMDEFVTNVGTIFGRIKSEVIDPVLNPILDEIERLWNQHFSVILGQVTGIVGKISFIVTILFLTLFNWALGFYNGFVSPIVNSLITMLSPAFEFAGKIIAKVIGVVGDTIAYGVRFILGVLTVLLDFIKTGLTEGWGKAWENLKIKFSAFAEGLKRVFKDAINRIIDYLNSFIDRINRIKIPDWVPGIGGKNININRISPLPMATGGIVESPTVTLLGEAGKEVVLPIENNTEWIDKLAMKLNRNDGQTIVIKIGDEKIYSRFINYLNERSLSGSLNLNI